jgi:hypothetical protein
VKAESKLWKKVKKNTPNITWTRVESWASFGFPDLVGYTEKQGFFTVELKVTKSKKVLFSPHQIAFHVKHPTKTWILAATLDPRNEKLCEYFLVPGSEVRELVACGLANRVPVACDSLERLLLEPRAGKQKGTPARSRLPRTSSNPLNG